MSGERFRVVTFNIHHGRGRDGRVDLERTARLLQELGPDLVALQELDVGVPRSGLVDQPQELRHKLGMDLCFFPTVQLHGGSYGIAIAARGVLDCTVHPLVRIDAEEPRAAIVATWGNVSVVATHLSQSRASQSAQSAEVVRLARELRAPRVVLGDLNQSRSRLSLFEQEGLLPVVPKRPLRWWLRPRVIVDHIVADATLRVSRARVVPTSASDHSAVVADFIVR